MSTSTLFQNVRQGLNLLFTPVLYYGVVASIALQLGTWEKGDRTQDKYQDQYQNQGDKFDFVIVGSGTSGSLLANRLSKDYNVLLLEAGGEPSPLQFVPGLARSIVNHAQVDWMHKTVAQKKSCAFSPFRRATWSAGKTLGGSGSLDFLMYLRGNPEDFNNWSRITNDPSWSYENLLEYFQKSEDMLANSTDPGAHRHGGALRIQQPPFKPLAKEFIAAARELGYANLDLNGHFYEGFDYVYSTIKRGERQLPLRAFLDPIRKRTTLTIRKYALVTKIKFRADNTAYGVEYERHGQKYLAYANREIILSAGTIGTPKILMLSGVGQKRHLEELGIKTLADLPVGQNLQDHVGTYLGPFFINEPLTLHKDKNITAESYVEYGTQGTGPLTSAGFVATGMIASLYAKGRGESTWPDVQLSLYPTAVDNTFATDLAHTHGLNPEILKKYYKHATGKHSFHIYVNVARPAGRGEIKLTSRNPTDPLVINPKYLEDPWDLDVKAGVDGLKKALRLVEGSTTFQNIGGRFTSEVIPGCESTKFRSDEYFECYYRHFTVSQYNPVGTVAMGPVDSAFAVVDSQLRVIGVRNLRVVDASVMPSIPSGTTAAPTIMIAEKAAAAILSYWRHHAPEEHPYHQPEIKPKPIGATLSLNSITDSTSSHSEPVAQLKNLASVLSMFSQSTPSPPTMKPMNPLSVTIRTGSSPPPPTRAPATVPTTKSPFASFLAFLQSSTPAPTTRPPAKLTTTTTTTTTTTPRPYISQIMTTMGPTTFDFGDLHEPGYYSLPIVSSTTSIPKTRRIKVKKKRPVSNRGANYSRAMTYQEVSSTPKPFFSMVDAYLQSTPSAADTFLPVNPTTASLQPTTSQFSFYEDDPTNPPVLSTSTSTANYEIQPAKELTLSDFGGMKSKAPRQDGLQPTTYRPQLLLMDSEEQTHGSVNPFSFLEQGITFDQLSSHIPSSGKAVTEQVPIIEQFTTENAMIPQYGRQEQKNVENSYSQNASPSHYSQPQEHWTQQSNAHASPSGGSYQHLQHMYYPMQNNLYPSQQNVQSQSPSKSSPYSHPLNLHHLHGSGEEDFYSIQDRFTRNNQFGQNTRYFEKPIKVHSYQHPSKVVRRQQKPTLSRSQSQVQERIMSQLRRFMPHSKNKSHKIPQRAQPHNNSPMLVQPANIIYQSQRQPMDNRRMDYDMQRETAILNRLNYKQLLQLVRNNNNIQQQNVPSTSSVNRRQFVLTRRQF